VSEPSEMKPFTLPTVTYKTSSSLSL